MRPLLALALALIPGLTPGVRLAPGVGLAAQAVERTDTPKRGVLRVTFDPRIMIWDAQFVDGRRERLGAPLTGDSVGNPSIPSVARLEQDVRTAAGLAGFTASLGTSRLSVRAERRVTPLSAELGITDRLTLGVTVPVVRVAIRSRLALDSTTANLGANPLALGTPGADTRYAAFFTGFDAALAQLAANIQAGAYGCPASPQCAQARALADTARGVREALRRSVYGTGSGGGAGFLPTAGSPGGMATDANVRRLQQELAATYGVAAFTQSLLLPAQRLDSTAFAVVLDDSLYGFGASLRNTRRALRYWLGDIDLALRYRFATGPTYAALASFLVRLPTGHLDSPHDLLDLSTGDHQTDLEVQLVQELVLKNRLWLNLSLRAGEQRPGIRERRVAPPTAFLVPRQALARLRWNPGAYWAADFAPLWRFTPQFAAGVTVGYWSRASDRYSFRAPQDSVDHAARLGAPTPASLLDGQTAERRLRVGVAVTYVRPGFEAGFSVERTVSGAAGRIPAATMFRIVLRTSRKLL